MSERGKGNTTALIAAWNMAGARSDLDGRFEPFVDINAVVTARDRREAAEPTPGTEPAPLLVKAADDADWQFLPGTRDAE